MVNFTNCGNCSNKLENGHNAYKICCSSLCACETCYSEYSHFTCPNCKDIVHRSNCDVYQIFISVDELEAELKETSEKLELSLQRNKDSEQQLLQSESKFSELQGQYDRMENTLKELTTRIEQSKTRERELESKLEEALRKSHESAVEKRLQRKMGVLGKKIQSLLDQSNAGRQQNCKCGKYSDTGKMRDEMNVLKENLSAVSIGFDDLTRKFTEMTSGETESQGCLNDTDGANRLTGEHFEEMELRKKVDILEQELKELFSE